MLPYSNQVQADSHNVNETVYQSIKEKILFGALLPEKSLTLRGLAEQLAVSPTPVREAVKRLISERALTMHNNRRVSVPRMSQTRLSDIRFARISIESKLAVMALSNIKKSHIRELTRIDKVMDQAIVDGNAEQYMRQNYAFHFTLYQLSQSEVLLAIAESLWLQMSPYLSAAFGQYGTRSLADDDYHKQIITALEAQDASHLHHAVGQDISQGLDTFSRE